MSGVLFRCVWGDIGVFVFMYVCAYVCVRAYVGAFMDACACVYKGEDRYFQTNRYFKAYFLLNLLSFRHWLSALFIHDLALYFFRLQQELFCWKP